VTTGSGSADWWVEFEKRGEENAGGDDPIQAPVEEASRFDDGPGEVRLLQETGAGAGDERSFDGKTKVRHR
jgi:hypothetical protein